MKDARAKTKDGMERLALLALLERGELAARGSGDVVKEGEAEGEGEERGEVGDRERALGAVGVQAEGVGACTGANGAMAIGAGGAAGGHAAGMVAVVHAEGHFVGQPHSCGLCELTAQVPAKEEGTV